MDNKDERNLTVIDGIKTEQETETKKEKFSNQTNPIIRKLLEFHSEKAKKFTVKDLFKK